MPITIRLMVTSTKTFGLTDRIYGSIAVWADGRKSSGPRIPITVTNSPAGGQVTVDGGSQSVPFQAKWSADQSNHTIAAISPRTVDALIYQFSSWSDAGAQSHSVSASLSNFAVTWTANFTVQKPTQVTGVSVGGSIGSPPHITWNVHSNADVNYYIYRKIRHNGVTGNEVYLATLSHSTSSYDDEDCIRASHSSDLAYYDVRAHHVPSGTFADQWWTAAGYVQFQEKPSPGSGSDNGRVTDYSLQVHPNPFNPVTTLSFTLPEAATVSLTVLDELGKEVAVLVQGSFAPDLHETTWNASNVASGVYFARLTVTNEYGAVKFTKVNKLLLMK
jgi:hypothetical protein